MINIQKLRKQLGLMLLLLSSVSVAEEFQIATAGHFLLPLHRVVKNV